ncbi:TonB-dependent receptor [Halosquirtibacter xylanolyticus]|uniref:SusC/RagA family TonB-linked outer membrane protein n=1 Tax=Halosquirtibacter xylanolyticus TaxID=3374599 RepID=UPI0037497D57|nr:TonB-dependent receptor [Prolixibacteraceae bacterium]
MKNILSLIIMMAFSFSLYAQTTVIQGIVKDNKGEPLPGVTVHIKGTSIGTITSFNGDYTLKVKEPKEKTLIFSFIGFEKQEKKIGDATRVDIVLNTMTTDLDEVVAIGYGTQKKKSLTGSISSVGSKDLANLPTTNVAAALSGKVSGVQITMSEGSPDAKVSIKVRGGGSITQSNEPLYIVDGFPSEDGINFIDPSDIETIDVLKDASSAAIYGSRGANGVILVTTKSGTKGKTRISYDGFYGVKQISKKMDLMNPYEFVLLQYENQYDEKLENFTNVYGEYDELKGLYQGRDGVDWQEEMFGGNAITQKHKVSINGGNSQTRYNVSYSYDDNQGIMVNSGFKRNSFRLKLDQKINDFLDATVTTSYVNQKTYGMGTSDQTSYFNKMTHIARYRPTIGKDGKDSDLISQDEDPIFEDENGNVMQNPVTSAYAETREKTRENLSINGNLRAKITKDLTATVTGGMNRSTRINDSFDGERSVTAKRRSSAFGSTQYEVPNSWSAAGTLNYIKTIGEFHKFNLLVGSEVVQTYSRYLKAEAANFPNDDMGLANMGLGEAQPLRSGISETALQSYFSRLNYNIDEKYLFSFTFRADGSSKFGSENIWGYFPSGSAAWRLSEEAFMQNVPHLSNLKVRLSYGTSGNDRIGIDLSKSKMVNDSYGFGNNREVVIVPANIPNPNLKWETTHSMNGGIDVGFFDQRVSLTIDYYKGTTKDLLLNRRVPLTTGYSTQMVNVGETENQGLDFTINTVNVETKNFTWTTNFNISTNKNKVKKLANGQTYFEASAAWSSKMNENDYMIRVGDPLGQMYGYVYDGFYRVDDFTKDSTPGNYVLADGIASERNVAAAPGVVKYKDLNNDGVIDTDDREVIGNANPDFYGGMTNTFSYKNFDLSIFVNFSLGNDVYNANRIYYNQGYQRNNNALAELNGRWTDFDGGGQKITNTAALKEMNKDATMPAWDGNMVPHFSTFAVEDASFLRINNITFGYTFPKKMMKRVGLNRLRIYGSVNNLYTFTNYSGFDPEVSTRNSTGLTPGVDWGAYPRSRTFIMGVNLSL